MCDVIGIGSLVIDIFKDSKFSIVESNRRGIEKYIMFPLGKKMKGAIHIRSGGSSGNTISYLSKIGVDSGYFTKIGTDYLSSFVISDMKKYGVNVKHIIKQPGLEVGKSLILISKQTKDTVLIVDHGSASHLTVDDVKKHQKFIFSAKWLDITSFTGKDALKSIEYIFSSEKRKAKIFFAPSRTMIMKFPKETKKLMLKSNASAVNKGEFELLFGELNSKKLKLLHKRGLRHCFITMSNKGMMYFDGKDIYIASPFKTSNIKNTTGAGDCADAWFLYGLMNNWNPKKILKYASAAGAIHVQSKYIGAKEGNPTKDEIEAFTKGKRFVVKKKSLSNFRKK